MRTIGRENNRKDWAALIILVMTILLMILTSCQEEVVVIKEPVESFNTAHFSNKIELDTVYQTDTISFQQTQYFVDSHFLVHVNSFYKEAKRYGWGELPKNNLLLLYWRISDFHDGYPQGYEGDGASIAYQVNGQWYVRINELIRQEGHYIAIYRELGRALLNKPYAAVGSDDMMSPTFNTGTFTDRPYDSLFARPYLDKLFNK